MITIDQNTYRRMFEEVSRDGGELCGFLMGKSNSIMESYPVKNVSRKKNHFEMSFFGKMFAVTNFFWKKYDTLIIYHTHPTEDKISFFDVIHALDFNSFEGMKIYYLVISSKSVNLYKISSKRSSKRVQPEKFEVR